MVGFESLWIMSLAVCGLLLLPLSGFRRCPRGWPRRVMLAAVTVLLLLGAGAIGLIELMIK